MDDRAWRKQIATELATINDEMGKLCERVARIEADLSWLKWFTMAILGGVIAMLLKVFFGG